MKNRQYHLVLLLSAAGWLGYPPGGLLAQERNSLLDWEIVYRLGSPLWSHQGVDALVLSKDGKKLVSVGLGRARIWDAENGELQGVFPPPGKEGAVTSWYFLPQGKSALACWNQMAVQLDIRTLSVQKTLALDCLELSLCPKGERVAILGTAKQALPRIDILDIRSGKGLVCINGVEKELWKVQWSPDGRWLGGISNNQLYLWTLHPSVHVRKWSCPSSSGIVSFSFSPDAQSVAVTTGAGDLFLWNIQDSEKSAYHVKIPGVTENTTRLPVLFLDDRVLVTGDSEGFLHYWDRTLHSLGAVRAHKGGRIDALVRSADGKNLYSVGADGLIRRWDLSTRKEVPVPGRFRDRVTAVAVDPSHHQLALGIGPVIALYDLAKGKEKDILGVMDHPVLHLAFSADGKYLAASTGSWLSAHPFAVIRVWDVATRKELFSYCRSRPGKAAPPIWLAVPHVWLTGKRLVFLETEASLNEKISGTLQDWDWRQKQRIQVWDCTGLSFAASPDNQWVAVPDLSNDHVHVYDLATGQLIDSVLIDIGGNISTSIGMGKVLRATVFFRMKGRELVVVTNKGLIGIWEIRDGHLVWITKWRISSYVEQCALSPAGRFLALSWGGGYIDIWDLMNKRLIGRSHLHADSVTSLLFVDEERLVSVGEDNTCVLSRIRFPEKIK
jgi:WD40 repeat protein